MRVLLFGATGMIGAGALLEALDDPTVSAVLTVGRRPTGLTHDKLSELTHGDFTGWSAVEDRLAGFDACLYCLGVSSGGMTPERYREITVGYTVAVGEVLSRRSPGMRMCFVSGAGTDRGSRQRWARVKAEAEDALSAMDFAGVHHFRPAGIQPLRGVTSGVRSYRLAYTALGWALPAVHRLMPAQLTTTVILGRAMLRAARGETDLEVLEGADIHALGSAPSA